MYLWICFCIFVFVFYTVYICKHPFSSKHIVFTPYNIKGWFSTPHIICKSEWPKTRFYKPYNIFIQPNGSLKAISKHIKDNYNETTLTLYSPDEEKLKRIHSNHEFKYYVCYFVEFQTIISSMTFRPLYLHMHNKQYVIQYADYLSTNVSHRKKNKTTSLYYTSASLIRDDMKSRYGSNVCDIFMSKKEGNPLPIVPFVSYTSFVYDIFNWSRCDVTAKRIEPMKIKELENIERFIEQIKIFPYRVYSTISNLQHLIKCKIIRIFSLYLNDDVQAYYIFKDESFSYNKKKMIECIGSITFMDEDTFFTNCFEYILFQLKDEYSYVSLELLSHNEILYKNVQKKYHPIYNYSCYYYLYNYIQRPIFGKNTICII